MITQYDCFQCGSKLLEVTKSTEGGTFPITVTVYRCSNNTCQMETDQKVNDAAQKLKDHQAAKKLRLNKKSNLSL